MVRNSHAQAEWKMGSCRWGHDAQLQWKWTSRIPWIHCFWTMIFAKRRKRKIVFTFLWRAAFRATVLFGYWFSLFCLQPDKLFFSLLQSVPCFIVFLFSQKKKDCLFISVVTTKQSKWFFAQSSPSISSASTEHLWFFWKYRENMLLKNNSETNRIVDNEQTTSDKWDGTKIRKSSRSSPIDQIVLQCR